MLKQAAAYIRVSTHDQEELSPDAQKRLIIEYAQKNNMIISNEHIYIEKGISGRKTKSRPAFLQMISAAKQDPCPFSCILVWKFSRFARNQEESIVYKSILKKQRGIDVISISEPIMDGPFGSLIERIIEWMDEYYSVRLSGEVHRGMTENAMRGKYQSRPPFGYVINQPKTPPVIIPEEAKIVQMIFDKYVNQGLSLFSIANWVNDLGIKTIRGNSFEVRGIKYILSNPTYIGKVRWNKINKETGVENPESEWIVRDGEYEPIISEELFDAANERLKIESRNLGKRPASTYKSWISGTVHCSNCGRVLGWSPYKKKDGTRVGAFQCWGYTKGLCKTSCFVSEHILKESLIQSLRDIIDSGEVEYERIDDHVSAVPTELDLLNEQFSKLDLKEQRIRDAYMNGIDSLEEYKRNKDLIQSEREHLQYQMDSLNIAPVKDFENEEETMLNRISSVLHVLESDSFTDEQKSNALHSIINNVVYDKKADKLDVFYALY